MDDDFEERLRAQLRHRIRPMRGRDPRERDRQVTPLELLYDLTYVVAFAAASDLLAEHLGAGDVWPAISAFAFAVWAVSWAWFNYSWFASAYGNDDLVLRIATIVQMVGVIVLTFGLPQSFAAAADGASPNNALMVAGYVVMRVPLIVLWVRAAREDPAHRANAVSWVVIVTAAQVGWILTVAVPLPVPVTVVAIVVIAVFEMVAPVLATTRLGYSPWNAGHVAERFSLLTLITIGEVIAGTTAAVGALTNEVGWPPEAVLIAASGLFVAAAVWWTYSLVPSRLVLERRPERTFSWRYAHLALFGTIAAIGAGLHLTTLAVEHGGVTLLGIALALTVPFALTVIVMLAIWSVLLRSFDLSHVPLVLATLVPLLVAVVVASLVAPAEAFDTTAPGAMGALSTVVGLVALSAVIEVVGHEVVGYRHTMEAWRRTAPGAGCATIEPLRGSGAGGCRSQR